MTFSKIRPFSRLIVLFFNWLSLAFFFIAVSVMGYSVYCWAEEDQWQIYNTIDVLNFLDVEWAIDPWGLYAVWALFDELPGAVFVLGLSILCLFLATFIRWQSTTRLKDTDIGT